ncbi:MAG: HNH endonuclease [Ignavibacteriaceae bacterium]
MFKCILCSKDFEDSERTVEHIFPESIGGNICISEVCKVCNSHLGENVDAPMINSFPIEAKRQLLKLAGKKGYIPNPLENGFLSTDPNQKVKYIFKDGSPESLYVVPYFRYVKDENDNSTTQIILDKKDEHKIPEILDKIIKRASANGKPVELRNIQRYEGRLDNCRIQIKKQVNLIDWQRCIIKIAYEMAFRKLGVDYLNNPIAVRIRDLLKKEKIDYTDLREAKIQANIYFVNDINAIPFVDDPNCLYAVFFPIDGKLICFVRIFDVYQGSIVVDDNYDGKYPDDAKIAKIDVINKSTEELDYLELIKQHTSLSENRGT